MSSLLMLSDLKRSFQGEEVLKGINLTLPRTGFIGVTGPSGSGKSTLLHVISGLDGLYQGRYVFDNQDMSKKSEAELADFRLKKVGYLLQGDSLLGLEDCAINVSLPLISNYKTKKESAYLRANALLCLVGLPGFSNKKVSKLSGGEKQRVALARALSLNPPLLICDEPTGALDEKNGQAIFSLLHDLSKDRLVIVTSHDKDLLRHYCDRLITLHDGIIVSDETMIGPNKKMVKLPKLANLEQKKKCFLPFSFLLSHGKKRRKSKKIRTFLSEMAISAGLLGLGASIYLSSSISSQIETAFSSVIPKNRVVMSPRSTSEQSISDITICSDGDAKYVASAYSDVVKGLGKSLIYDFETSFEDGNEFTYRVGSKMEVIPGLSIRSINDFIWTEEVDSFSSSLPLDMDWSELILGLPYASMAKLCGDYGLVRGYEPLNEFCLQGALNIRLLLSNLSWNLSETTTFRVRKVVPSSFPCFYHSEIDWNQEILFSHLRFKDAKGESPTNPQECKSIPFVVISCPYSSFLHRLRRDEFADGISFDLPSSTYLPSICASGTSLSLPRCYLYTGKRNGISFPFLDQIEKSEDSILGKIPSSEGSYFASSSSSVMGFRNKFFLSLNEEGANELVDAYSDLPLDQAFLQGDLPSDCIDGGLLSTGNNQLRISCDFTSISNETPKSIDEVYLSSFLYKSWNSPKEVFVCAESKAETIGTRYSRDFVIRKLKVLGSIDESFPVLFCLSNWTLDFYLDELGVSPLQLEITDCVFQIKEGIDYKNLASKLEKKYPKFHFTSPSAAVSESINETLSYVGTILYAFSFIALSVSLMLYLLVTSLTIAENKNEARLLFILGIPRAGIYSLYAVGSLLYASSSLLSSCVGMLFAQIGVSFFLSYAFGTQFNLSFSLLPILFMNIGAVLLFALILILLKVLFSKKDFLVNYNA